MTASLFIYLYCSGRRVKARETGASPRYKETAAGKAMLIFAFFFCVFSALFHKKLYLYLFILVASFPSSFPWPFSSQKDKIHSNHPILVLPRTKAKKPLFKTHFHQQSTASTKGGGAAEKKGELMKKASLVAARDEKSLESRTLQPKAELLGKGQPWQSQAGCNL